MRVPELWKDPRWAVSFLALFGYLGVAFGVRCLYPFSVFDMYSRRFGSASRIVARDAQGKASELVRYEGWQCEGPVEAAPERCGVSGSFFYVPYLDTDAVAYIEGHPGEGRGEAVDVVRRIWWLEGTSAPRVEDCLLQRCRAVRR